MNSRTTERFRRSFDQLPEHIQHRARLAYDVFREDPYHASLRFKKVHATRPIFSVRVGLAYSGARHPRGRRDDLVLDRLAR